MKRVTHLFIGLSVGFILCHQPTLCLYILIPSIIGSYLPDFDLKKSHRKLLHNFSSMLIFTCLIWFSLDYLKPPLPVSKTLFAGAFLLGYLSHLFLDLLTPKGVSLLYPLSRRVFSAKLCKSNNVFANLVFIAVSLLVILLRMYEMVGEKILPNILGFLL